MRRAITRVMVSVLGVVCVTVALVGLAQADGTGPHREDHMLGLRCSDRTNSGYWIRPPACGGRRPRIPRKHQDLHLDECGRGSN